MELTKKLLTELQNRLKIGSRRGVHLNAIPARSRYKFDFNRLSYIDKNLPKDFIYSLLTEQPLKFKISWKDNVPDLNSLFKEDQEQIVKITKSFDNLINQTETIESEKGINTFGFGFPILIRRDQLDGKLTVAPILIWSLRIKRTREFNTWVIQRNEDDPIYINEVLINHLQNDSKIVIDPISSEMLDDGLIDREELLDICINIINSINSTYPENIRDVLRQKLDNIKSIADKKHYEKLPLTFDNSLIEFCGLFSIFEVQKQNIINDYDLLMELEGSTIDLDDMAEHSFQTISSVETDPSQQSILHSLESKRNILIQGPPGTGKSQSLTAILINALENHKKTIVVCEKRTALEVLQNALNNRGLRKHCILIKDIIKERRTVVNSVRDRIERKDGRNMVVFSKMHLDNLTKRSKSLIDSINKKHKKLDKKLLNNKNWTHTVGLLLSELKNNYEDSELSFNKTNFKYDSQEFNELLIMVQKGQALYEKYKPFKRKSFINPSKFTGDNPFIIEQQIKDDFNKYDEVLHGKNAIIQNILNTHKKNPDLFDIKRTSSLKYKFLSIFSKERRKTLNDQKTLLHLCVKLKGQVNNDNWIKKSIDKEQSQEIIEEIKSLIKNKNEYFENENDDLFAIEYNWFQFYNALPEIYITLIDELKSRLNWRRVFLIYYLNSLLVNFASNELPANDCEHKELKDSLSLFGKEQVKYIKEYWSSRQKDVTKNFDTSHQNISVVNLYNKRSSQRYKRLSLRQIVKYNPDLFSTFFPIILTTPDVCSNLFKGMNKYFDIVLFDEASQLRLEDNLPALLKGKQIIIAGDEHQMPPSNYFSKIFDGVIDDEEEIEEDEEIQIDRDNILLSCESLLDFALELNFEKKYLDFHYRSRHPFLIDFSNHAFYNKRLQPLPNHFDYSPIKYIQVNGTFSDHSNEREAEAVISIIENNIHRLPNGEYPSVGIATFNIAHRNLIISKILERKKFEKYADFNNKVIELEENGLFVKNLENIQGDERDVIILSTTYGLSSNGRFMQRFGPINHKKGYKLLNVIITRAKYKIYVCSSIPEQVILNYKEHLLAESSNNRRAVFFAYLAYAKAVSENDHELRQSVLNALSENTTDRIIIDNYNAELESPFEEEVYQVLVENFDKRKITPQLQFAGFRIDIVYDSLSDRLPKIAIECDGASYHSSKEAYLYDLHRQKILEGHGFVFHRIWSTNWWRNPQREANRLIEFIKNIESKEHQYYEKTQNIDMAFTDDLSAIKIYQKPHGLIEEKLIPEIESNIAFQTTLFEDVVNKNSTVKIKYLNKNKDLKIQLVHSKSSEYDQEHDIQRVHNKSPLAISIIGKSVGDTVKVGNLDTYVEIMEIMN